MGLGPVLWPFEVQCSPRYPDRCGYRILSSPWPVDQNRIMWQCPCTMPLCHLHLCFLSSTCSYMGSAPCRNEGPDRRSQQPCSWVQPLLHLGKGCLLPLRISAEVLQHCRLPAGAHQPIAGELPVPRWKCALADGRGAAAPGCRCESVASA